jgi:DNA topoisomerase-1
MNVTRYLKDSGITRKGPKTKRVYRHTKNNRRVSKKDTERIESLRIPPQWKRVWIASSPLSHIQATGYDAAGRKQYIYSERWINSKKNQKFKRMQALMQQMPTFKVVLRTHLKDADMSKDKTLAAMFDVMLKTGIRAGNEVYAETNGTYGLASLQQKHLVGNTLTFVGKSGKEHRLSIARVSRPTKAVLRHGRTNKKPGDPLFPYSAADMNAFLKRTMKIPCTCKDFRMIRSNEEFIRSFLQRARKCPAEMSPQEIKGEVILKAVDDSAAVLGNTRNVCRSSYLHPGLLDYCLNHFETAKKNGKKELWKIAIRV